MLSSPRYCRYAGQLEDFISTVGFQISLSNSKQVHFKAPICLKLFPFVSSPSCLFLALPTLLLFLRCLGEQLEICQGLRLHLIPQRCPGLVAFRPPMTKGCRTGKVGCGMSMECRLSPLCRCAPKFPSCGGQSTFPAGSSRRHLIGAGGT